MPRSASLRPAVSDQELGLLSSLFQLLADKTRLQILTVLSHGERNVTDLCAELDLPQPTVSHHLGLLRVSNLLDHRRLGKQVLYRLAFTRTRTSAVLSLPAHRLLVCIVPRGKARR